MRKFWFLIIFSSFFLTGLSKTISIEDFDKQILKAKKLIAEGVDRWDDQIMLNARTLFEKLLRNEEMEWLTHYYIGYVDFRLSMYYRIQNNKDLQLKHLTEGIEHFYASLDLNGEFAESHALLAFLLGQKARMDSSQMAVLGMEAQTAISDARELGEENPRVAMISGIMYFFTPEQFGGSKIKAMEELKRSVSLFRMEKLDDERFPDWGHSDALTWQGRLYMEAKELGLAKQSLKEALKVNPKNKLAQRLKLQLQQQMSEK